MGSEECLRQHRGLIRIPGSLEPVLSKNLTALPQDVPCFGRVSRVHKGFEFFGRKDDQQTRMMNEPHWIRISRIHLPRGWRKTIRHEHMRRAQFFRERSFLLEEGEIIRLAI